VVWEVVCGGEAGGVREGVLRGKREGWLSCGGLGMVHLTRELLISNLQRLSITPFTNGEVSYFGIGRAFGIWRRQLRDWRIICSFDNMIVNRTTKATYVWANPFHPMSSYISPNPRISTLEMRYQYY
jgi:hypothetical protein